MNTPNKPTAPALSGVYVATLAALAGGKVLEELDDTLRIATAAALNAGAKAKVSLELTIVPAGTGIGETPLFKVEEKVKSTIPKKARPASNFFVDEENNLTRRAPNQTEMPLRELEGGAGVAITKAQLQAATS
jgi:hypothetical protein